MNTYAITIPAFTLHITAENKREALELFWFELDNSEIHTYWDKPVVKVIKSNLKSA